MNVVFIICKSACVRFLPTFKINSSLVGVIQGTIKTFMSPVLWEWPRAEIVPLFLNLISLCLDALSPMLFQIAYPFKVEAFFLVAQVLINSICDAFIASKIPTMKVIFHIWKQKSKGEKSRIEFLPSFLNPCPAEPGYALPLQTM